MPKIHGLSPVSNYKLFNWTGNFTVSFSGIGGRFQGLDVFSLEPWIPSELTFSCRCPASTRRWPGVCVTLAQRRRRWANATPTLGERLVLAGKGHSWCERWPKVGSVSMTLETVEAKAMPSFDLVTQSPVRPQDASGDCEKKLRGDPRDSAMTGFGRDSKSPSLGK